MPVFNITLTSSETGDTVRQTINAVNGAAARNIAESQAPDSSYRVGNIVQLDDAVELERARQANLGRDFSVSNRDLLAIDEGFGVLDSDNLNSMYMLFDYLKSQFSFIMCISHIDAMRDIVDKLIEIKKVSGYSEIDFT